MILIQNQAVLDLGAEYVDLATLYANSHVISLHSPINRKKIIIY